MADLEPVQDPEDVAILKGLIEDHKKYTGSTPAANILADWDAALQRFKKIMPRDYRRVLEERKGGAEEDTVREMEAVGNG
jgi:glutamate synthase (NADPH/NADH)